MVEAVQTSYVKRRAGNVESAWLDWGKAGLVLNKVQRGRSAAQNAGLRFEAKVSEELYERFPGFLAQVPFNFVSDFCSEKCILDGIIFWSEGQSEFDVILLEMKSRHTADGWFQLKFLYLPVVRKAFPGKRLRLLEICKSYEEVKLPDPAKLWPSVEKFIEGGDVYGVVAWR